MQYGTGKHCVSTIATISMVNQVPLQSADGGVGFELDGDEVANVWTDEGKEAYVIYSAFACGASSHLWCGSGGCSTQ